MDKENFYTSVRFWTFVLTPLVVAGLELAAQYVPAVKELPKESVVSVVVSVVVMAITFILARTVRNTPTKPAA